MGLIQFLFGFECPAGVIQDTSVDSDPEGPANTHFECGNHGVSRMNHGAIWSVLGVAYFSDLRVV